MRREHYWALLRYCTSVLVAGEDGVGDVSVEIHGAALDLAAEGLFLVRRVEDLCSRVAPLEGD